MKSENYIILTELKGNLKNKKTLQFVIRRYRINYETPTQFVCTKIAKHKVSQTKRVNKSKENIPYGIHEWPPTGAISGRIYFQSNNPKIDIKQIRNQISTLKRAIYDFTHLGIPEIEKIKPNYQFLY